MRNKPIEKIRLTPALRRKMFGIVDDIRDRQKTTLADIAEAIGLTPTRLRDILSHSHKRYIDPQIRDALIDLHGNVIAGCVQLPVSHQGHESPDDEYVLITDEIRALIREVYEEINAYGEVRTKIPGICEIPIGRYRGLINVAKPPSRRSPSLEVYLKIKVAELEIFMDFLKDVESDD